MTIENLLKYIDAITKDPSISQERKIFAVNMACDFVFSQLGLPNLEKEYEIDFYQDDIFYDLPSDYVEPISLRFKDKTIRKKFSYRPSEFLLTEEKALSILKNQNLFGEYTAKGKWQMVILGKNNLLPKTLISFNTLDNISAENDATNLATDSDVYKQAPASLKFDIDSSLSGNDRATIVKSSLNFDLTNYYPEGKFRLWLYMPSTVSSVSLKLYSSDTAYFTMTTTTQRDGSSFEEDEWNDLAFDFSSATAVNSPNYKQITKIAIDLDYDASFAGDSDYRLDYLRVYKPDKLILTYYTAYKGTDSSGSPIKDFSDTTDIILIDNFDPALKNLIVYHAASIIAPQVLETGDITRQFYVEYMKVLQKRYPRKRAKNFLWEPRMK